MRRETAPDGAIIVIGTVPEVFPINGRLYNLLIDLGMTPAQAYLYILRQSVSFSVGR